MRKRDFCSSLSQKIMEKVFLLAALSCICSLQTARAPPSPPPPRPSPTSTTEGTPTATENTLGDIFEPLVVMEDQCSLGTNYSNYSNSLFDFSTEHNKLYVDFGEPAPCSGVITGWEACVTSPTVNGTLDFLVLENDPIRGHFEIKGIYKLTFQSPSPRNGLDCKYVERKERIEIVEGDFIGFQSRSLQLALVELPDGSNSTLRVYDFASDGQLVLEGRGNSLQNGGMDTPHSAALFRTIISKFLGMVVWNSTCIPSNYLLFQGWSVFIISSYC